MHSSRQMITALTVSSSIVVLNIIAVTQNSGENYYRVLQQFITGLLP